MVVMTGLCHHNCGYFASLLCSPLVSIQIRQVWTTGNGNLTLGKPHRNRYQGNVDFYQANYLLSYALLGFSTRSSSVNHFSRPSGDRQEIMVFKWDFAGGLFT